MGRKRSEDYQDKVNAILEAAAVLFAERGYNGCSIDDIADQCAMSRSLVFYYFPKKENILFTILKEHTTQLRSDLGALIEGREKGADQSGFFLAFVGRYLEITTTARSYHAVTLSDRRFLPPDLREEHKRIEADVLGLVIEALRGVNGTLDDRTYKTSALLLVGMINSTIYWYRPSGTVSIAAIAERVRDLFLPGFVASAMD